MNKFRQAVVLVAILSNGCFGLPDDLITLQSKGSYAAADLLRTIYHKSFELRGVKNDLFLAVHSNLTRTVLDVSSKSATFLINGMEKLETIQTKVKSILNVQKEDNFDCVTKVENKFDKVLHKIGNNISDCAAMADQQVQDLTNRTIDLGSEVLGIPLFSLSDILGFVREDLQSGISFNDLSDIKEEYEEAFADIDKNIYDNVIPFFDKKMNSVREQALAATSTVELCLCKVLMKLDYEVSEVEQSVGKC